MLAGGDERLDRGDASSAVRPRSAAIVIRSPAGSPAETGYRLCAAMPAAADPAEQSAERVGGGIELACGPGFSFCAR
jgi:hypothetical protein